MIELLLVLSRNSADSPWVKREVEAAFERERIRNEIVLFPISLDETVLKIEHPWASAIRRIRHMANFSDWQDEQSYQRGLDKLLHDLSGERWKPTTSPLERMLNALRDGKFVWRCLEHLAIQGGLASEEEAMELLRSRPELRFSKGKSGKRIARLAEK